MAGWDGGRPVSATISVRPGCSPDRGCRASGCGKSWLPPSGPAAVHAVEHGTARAGIGGEFGVRQEVQGRVELMDRTRAGLLLGVERILDTADEEAPGRSVGAGRGPPRAKLVADGLQHVLYRRQDVLLAVAEARQVVALDVVEGVKTTCSLLALPETAMPLRAATGAACIGWAALSTSNTAATRPRCPAGCGPEQNWRPDDGPVSRGKD
jgi:hypothetical protein